MTPTEHPPKTPQSRTGFFALLAGLLHSKGTTAPKITPAVNPVQQQAAAGKLTDLVKPHARCVAKNTATQRRSGYRRLVSLPAVVSYCNRLTAAVRPATVVSPVQQETAAGKLTDLGSSKRVLRSNNNANQGSPHALLRSLTIAPLLVLIALVFAPGSALAATPETPETGKANPATITATTATLEDGVLNPHAAGEVGEYEYRFRASETECEGESSTTPEVAAGNKKEAVPPVDLTNLQPNTHYTFCLIEHNLGGEYSLPSTPAHFLTESLAPTVGSESSSSIKATEAHVEAGVNAENETTECHFQYGTAVVTEHEAECEQGALSGGGEQGVGVTLTGLEQGTAYKWRVVVKNPTGEKEGAEDTFTTAITPEISGSQAAQVTGTTATLEGVLNATKPGDADTYEFLYDQGAGCEGGQTTTQATSTGTSPEPVSADIEGLLPGTEYTFCLHASNNAGEPLTGEPVTFTTTAVGLEDSPTVTATEALVTAEIGTDNAETTYAVQYGTVSVEEHTTPTPEASIPASSKPTPVQQTLTGLAPATIYHFRFLANNGHGPAYGEERTFTTPAPASSESTPSEASCKEKYPTQLPRTGYSTELPDCRAYEMVSPTQTNGNDATEPFIRAGPVRASEPEEEEAEGEEETPAITYDSRGSFAEPEGAIFQSQLLSRRNGKAGRWETRSITAPQEHDADAAVLGYNGAFFTPELTKGLTATAANLTTAPEAAPEGLNELYLATFPKELHEPISYKLVSHLPPSEEEYAEPYKLEPSVYPLGASSGLNHVVFATENESNAIGPLREWLAGRVVSRVVFVGVPNEGEPWTGASVGDSASTNLGGGAASVWRAVSEDGSRVIFNYSGEQLYARVNAGAEVAPEPGREQSALNAQGECTEPAKACTVKLSAGAAKYWGANTEDTKIFYVENGDLYEYELPTGSVQGQARALTSSGEVQGVVQISEDGSYVYFVARKALKNAHGETLENISGAEPFPGADNLYVSHEGTPAFIATLSPDDGSDWQDGPGGDAGVLAPGAAGGAHLAFTSAESLTGYDNRQAQTGDCSSEEDAPCSEVYLYDAKSGVLTCASCDPSGARPVGPASLATGRYGILEGASNYRPRDLLADGSLFFDSSDALVAHSSGGVGSVYEYEDGRVYPISDPAGRYESFFLDATPGGTNVFFATADQLVPQDKSTNVVVYVARKGGGFPLSTVTPPCTTAESCEPSAPSEPGVYGPEASATFSGPGNLAPSPPPPPKHKTAAQERAEKLAKALKACRRKHNKHKRQACEKQARKKYGTKASKAAAQKPATRATNDRRASR